MDDAQNSASNGSRINGVIENGENPAVTTNEPTSKNDPQTLETTEKRIGCAHYKRRAKFVVNI